MAAIKLLCIGDIGTGKTSLLVRFADNSFDESGAAATIGMDFKSRSLEVDGETVEVEVWDTAGAERFGTMTSNFYRGTDGVVIVYDCADQKTFDNLSEWIFDCDRNGCENAEKLVLANKADLGAVVEASAGRTFADNLGIPFASASAKSGEGVEDAFATVVRAVLSARKSADAAEAAPSTVAINRSAGKPKKSKGGCALL